MRVPRAHLAKMVWNAAKLHWAPVRRSVHSRTTTEAEYYPRLLRMARWENFLPLWKPCIPTLASSACAHWIGLLILCRWIPSISVYVVKGVHQVDDWLESLSLLLADDSLDSRRGTSMFWPPYQTEIQTTNLEVRATYPFSIFRSFIWSPWLCQ